jgi:Outer membrane protein beta-barrel domain
MVNKFLAAVCVLYSSSAIGSHSVNSISDNHFYIGVTGGYGWTTWGGLVPSKNNQNLAISISTPKFVNEGGALWGGFAGYEFYPYFDLEFAYMRYPNDKITFDPSSIFSFDHDGLTDFITHTETFSLMVKIMLMIPKTCIKAYSSFGAAEVHRKDQINNHYRTSPTFGLGLDYNVTPHIMTELGANYVAGYGESELNPAQDYFPFLYSVFFRLAYRF